MKLAKTVLLVAILAVFASCKQSGLTPDSTTVSGDLSKCFTVVDREYTLTQDGDKSIVAVEFERTAEALPFELYGRTIESFSETDGFIVNVGFGVEFLDKDGNVVKKIVATDVTNAVNTKDCLSLMNLKEGEKGTIRIVLPTGEDAKKITKFRISSAYKVEPKTVNLSGTVDKYPIQMQITFNPDGTLNGEYFYTASGSGALLEFKGEVDKDGKTVKIIEKYNDKVTGKWDLNVKSFSPSVTLGGSMVNYNNKRFVVNLSESGDELSSGNSSYGDVESYSDGDDSVSSGANNIDAVLDKYDRYVTQYISLIKKAANGDVSALSEYADLMETADELADELTNMKGEMTSAQLARFQKILNRFSSAAL